MVCTARIVLTVGAVVCGAAATVTEDRNQTTNTSALEMQPFSPSRILHKYENENKAKLTKDKLKLKTQRWGLERNPWRGMKALDFGRGTYGGVFGSKVSGFDGGPSDKVRSGSAKEFFSGTGLSNKAFSYSGGKSGSIIPLIDNNALDTNNNFHENAQESNHQFVRNNGNLMPSRQGSRKTKLDLSGRGIFGISGGKPLFYNYRFT